MSTTGDELNCRCVEYSRYLVNCRFRKWCVWFMNILVLWDNCWKWNKWCLLCNVVRLIHRVELWWCMLVIEIEGCLDLHIVVDWIAHRIISRVKRRCLLVSWRLVARPKLRVGVWKLREWAFVIIRLRDRHRQVRRIIDDWYHMHESCRCVESHVHVLLSLCVVEYYALCANW